MYVFSLTLHRPAPERTCTRAYAHPPRRTKRPGGRRMCSWVRQSLSICKECKDQAGRVEPLVFALLTIWLKYERIWHYLIDNAQMLTIQACEKRGFYLDRNQALAQSLCFFGWFELGLCVFQHPCLASFSIVPSRGAPYTFGVDDMHILIYLMPILLP